MAKRSKLNQHNRIRQLRETAGLARSEFAAQVGIGLSTLARYESATFSGRISAAIQEKIATALGTSREAVFLAHDDALTRRQFVAGVGALGVGLGFTLSNMHPPLTGAAFSWQRNRQSLSQAEMKALADENYGLWELLNSLQRGSSLDYVAAVAQGKIVALQHLTQCSVLPDTRRTLLILLADIYLLLGRICRETQNYGAGDYYCLQAGAIAREVDDPNLKAAYRLRYGHMLIDQGRYAAAVRAGEAVLIEAKGASFPIWAESQLVAAHAFAHVGRFSEAVQIAYRSRNALPGGDPEIWIGKITNPRTVYAHFDVDANLAAQRYYDATRAAETSLAFLDQEEPDNTQWRSHLQNLSATALWRLGTVDEGVLAASESLRNARLAGSLINESRVEKLYQQMRTSPHKNRQSVRDLGEFLMAD